MACRRRRERSSLVPPLSGAVAQSEERLFRNEKAAGAIPACLHFPDTHPRVAEQQMHPAVNGTACGPSMVRVHPRGPLSLARSSKAEQSADNRSTAARYRPGQPLCCRMEQRQLAWLITTRPAVRVRLLHPYVAEVLEDGLVSKTGRQGAIPWRRATFAERRVTLPRQRDVGRVKVPHSARRGPDRDRPRSHGDLVITGTRAVETRESPGRNRRSPPLS